MRRCGCKKVLEEQVSSREKDRPEFRAATDYCRGGDELVVRKLDRSGRPLRKLVDLVNESREQGAEPVPLREGIDTTIPGG